MLQSLELFALSLVVVNAITLRVATAATMEEDWPPTSIGNNHMSQFGLAPRAFFSSACAKKCGPGWICSYTCEVFGGVGPSGKQMADQYELFATQYPALTQKSIYAKTSPPGMPTARSGATMVTLRESDDEYYFFMYGGTTSDGEYSNDIFLYAWSEDVWYQVTPSSYIGETQPPLTLHSMVSIDGRQSVTVFFGASSIIGMSNTVYQGNLTVETAEFSTFEKLYPSGEINETSGEEMLPTARVSSCCAANTALGLTICFGGSDGTNTLGDTWLFDHDNTFWTLITPDVTAGDVSPPPRQNAQCTYLRDHGTVLLVGGFSDISMNPINDRNVYAFDFTWRKWYVAWQLPSVVPLRGGGALHRTVSAVTYLSFVELVGGLAETGALGDRWAFNVSDFAKPPSESSSSAAAEEQESGNTPWYKLESDSLVPEAREFHSSVSLSTGMLIAFGVSSSSLLSNVYYCQYAVAPLSASAADLGNVCTWFLLNATGGSDAPSGRFAASACSRGNVVYFFGGFTSPDKSTLSSELWALVVDLQSVGAIGAQFFGTWQLMTPSTAVSSTANDAGLSGHSSVAGRACHSSVFVSDNQFLVVGGVIGSATDVTNSVMAFDLQEQLWFDVSVTPAFTQRAGFAMLYDGWRMYLVGGITYSATGVDVLGDIVMLTIDARRLTASATTITTNQPIYRAFAASGAVGGQMILCGGAVQVTLQAQIGSTIQRQCALILFNPTAVPPSAAVTFYSMSRVQYSHTYEAAGFGGGGAFIGESFVIFGGAIVMKQVQRHAAFYDVTQTFRFDTLLCSLEAVLASQGAQQAALSCIQCGPGSMNPTSAAQAAAAAAGLPSPRCTFAGPGTYISPMSMTVQQCFLGRYLNSSGASSAEACVLCPAGSYASSLGSTGCTPCPSGKICPLGAVEPLNSTSANAAAFATQPNLMLEGQTPNVIYVAAGSVVGFLVVALVLVSWMAHRVRQARRAYFFDEPAVVACRTVYERYKRSHFGLDAPSLALSLNDLGLASIPQELVTKILAENDQDGSCHVTFTAFQDVIIAMIERGLMKPFPGTNEDLMPGKSVNGYFHRKLAGFRFKDLDTYDTDHALGVEGEPISIHSTVSGGVTRVCFNILAIGVALALIGQFVFTNITESRALVPSVGFSASDMPDADDSESSGTSASSTNGILVPSISITVTAIGGVQIADDCVLAYNGTTAGFTVCAGNNNISTSSSAALGGSCSLSCQYVASAQSCTMKLHCEEVVFAYGSTVTFDAILSQSIYAPELLTEVQSDSGIEGQMSQSNMLIAATNGFVFRGYPATVFAFPLLPTAFETVSNLVTQASVSSTGSHVLMGIGNPGNEISPLQMSQFYGVPVQITFNVRDSILSVQRMPKSTFLDFISQMLGAITGMGGLLVTVMQMYDSKFIGRRHEKLREELEEAAMEGNVEELLEKESRRKLLGTSFCRPTGDSFASGLDVGLLSAVELKSLN